MKLIHIAFDHLKMFRDGTFSLDFYASDKVPTADETVYTLDAPLYTNCIIALAGINASGKTSALDLVRLALRILNGQPIFGPFAHHVTSLFRDNPTFTAVFWDKGTVYTLISKLNVDFDGASTDFDEPSVSFVSETVFTHTGQLSKKRLQSIEALLEVSHPSLFREQSSTYGPEGNYISPFISIVATLSYEPVPLMTLGAGNTRIGLQSIGSGIDAILQVLDSSIEYLRRDSDGASYELKFKNDNSSRLLNPNELAQVLSSGTRRGISMMERLVSILQEGGYLLVDEIENHLNKQIVNVIIELFSSRNTNPFGATLVLTTHYPEILDQIHRKDNVFFLVRDDTHTAQIQKYSEKVKRIENKKSEVFISNLVKGTAPRYTDVKALREFVRKSVED